jgi:hypothetical protein
MKISFVFAIAILFLSSCYKDNLSPIVQIPLSNADMESGTTQPTGWFYGHTAPEIQMTWATNESSSPSHSLEMSRNAITDATSFAAWAQIYQRQMQ